MALSSLRLRRALCLSSSLLHHPHFLYRRTISPLPSISPFLSSGINDQNPTNPINSEFQSIRLFRSSAISLSSRQRRWEPTDEPEIGPDTILFEGCDYNHWLITMDMPEEYTAEQMVQAYVDAAAKVFGSEEEAKKKIYACSTTVYRGFQVECSEEVSEKFKDVPGVVFVLPDSYIDPVNKEYGGDKYVNGTIIPRPPPIQYRRREERSADRRSRPRNFGPPQNPPPQQNYGSPQGPSHFQNYAPPQNPPVQQNYGPPQNPPVQQNYGLPQGPPQQQSYGQPLNPPPQHNYDRLPNPAPQLNYRQPLNPPRQQNYGYPPPQQNYGQQQTPPPPQNYGRPQNFTPQQNYGQQQNLTSQQQYGHQQDVTQQNYGAQRTNFPSQQNYGPQRTNFPNQQNYGPTGGVPQSGPTNAPEGWNNYQGGRQDAPQGDQGGFTSPDQRNFTGQGQRYMHQGGGFGQGQGGSLGQEAGPADSQNYMRNGDQRFSQGEHGNNILGGD